MGNLTHQELLQILFYDPLSGNFFWKVRPARKIQIGDLAGSVKSHGYVEITYQNVRYYAHNLAWFYMTGAWPANLIDHENTIRSDNRFNNLRPATGKQNAQNVNKHSDNQTGFKGVAKNRSKFSSKIYINGKNIHLGSYDTPEEAAEIYDEAAKQAFGPFALTNKSMGLI